MNRNGLRKRRFTLVELLVAMGVFIIMLGLMLEFFSGAQKVWTGMERRNDVYAGARVAMDLMTNLLQSQISTEENIPFVVIKDSVKDSGDRDKNTICFFTNTPFNVGNGDSIRAVHFSLNSSNELEVRWLDTANATGSDPSDYEAFLRAFNLSGTYTSINSAGIQLESKLKSNAASVVAEHVTGFSIAAFAADGSTVTLPSYVIPSLIVIRLYMLDQKSYDIWKDISNSTQKKVYLQQNERVFARSVFLGDISKTVD